MEVDLQRAISLGMSFIYNSARACEKSALFLFLGLQVHISVALSLNHTLYLSSRLNRQYVCGDLTNPGRIKCPKTNRLPGSSYSVFLFFFFFFFSLFVFPPSSGLTPSQYAVSVLERKSQTGTSSRRSCCPAPTVGAVVSPAVGSFTRLNIL